jgi:hypothetical protein
MSRYLLNTEKLKNMFYEDNLSLHYLYHNVSKKSRDLFYWWLHYTKHTFYGRDFSKNQKEILNNIYIVKCKSTKCNNWIKENSDCYRCYERKNKKKIEKLFPKIICQESTTCSICISDIEKNAHCIRLKCSHIYHIDCICKWSEKHMNCPYCRRDIK